MGANIDARREAEKIGISGNRSVTYENDSKGVELNFKAVGKAISKAVESDAIVEFMDEHWADEIQAYKEKIVYENAKKTYGYDNMSELCQTNILDSHYNSLSFFK